jgi:hypothetical protein
MESFEMEYRLRRHDGEYRWLFDRGAPFYVDGVFAGFIGSCVDVHARVEAEGYFRHRTAEMDRLSSACSPCAPGVETSATVKATGRA